MKIKHHIYVYYTHMKILTFAYLGVIQRTFLNTVMYICIPIENN